jgi:Glycosyltransferases involved in cell wall biogenesis
MQPDQPLVSILMNCYNGEKYLRPALDSVVAQTYPDWELIFWDNQSTDRSAEICKSYGDPRIRYFYAAEHTELGAARILAFQQVRGELVAILDADDIAHPERLARQVAFLREHPATALVGSWARFIDENGKSFAEFKPPVDERELHDCLGWIHPIVHSSTMYCRAAAVRVGGYSADLIYASDLGLILALAQHFRIAMISEFLCQFRLLSSSMTRSRRYHIVVAREGLALFQRAAETLPLSRTARRLNRRALAGVEIALGVATLRSGSVLQGMKMVLHGLWRDPSVLWLNGRVRKFFGGRSGFLEYSRES